MNQSNKDTDDILDAIKSMMSNDQHNSEQGLPKDIIELTKPIDEKQINESESSILELTELVANEVPRPLVLHPNDVRRNQSLPNGLHFKHVRCKSRSMDLVMLQVLFLVFPSIFSQGVSTERHGYCMLLHIELLGDELYLFSHDLS